uniref:Uncharacterized protein n=1 Tax=Rhizophora mucronata TaxID=61149 RepID=A0A2P2QQD2_RHIMU
MHSFLNLQATQSILVCTHFSCQTFFLQ